MAKAIRVTTGRTRHRPLILFDGVCTLCNRAVRWVIERDRDGRVGHFDFASLQSKVARAAIEAAGSADRSGIADHRSLDPRSTDSIIVIEGGRVLTRSDAAIAVARRLGLGWRALAAVGSIVPRHLRDLAYDGVARNRYRWFGRRDACMTPCDADRSRFLDANE